MHAVSVQCQGAYVAPLSPAAVRLALLDMLETAGIAEAEVDVLLTRDAVMAGYNARFMGCTGPTNVLSFPAAPLTPVNFVKKNTAQNTRLAGSLIISVDTIRREAKMFSKSACEHTLCLLAHGLGHLAGYEHGQEMDFFCSKLLVSNIFLQQFSLKAT